MSLGNPGYSSLNVELEIPILRGFYYIYVTSMVGNTPALYYFFLAVDKTPSFVPKNVEILKKKVGLTRTSLFLLSILNTLPVILMWNVLLTCMLHCVQ